MTFALRETGCGRAPTTVNQGWKKAISEVIACLQTVHSWLLDTIGVDAGTQGGFRFNKHDLTVKCVVRLVSSE